MYKILQRNTLIELSQIILDLEKQGKINYTIDQGEKPKLLLIRKKSNCIIIIQARH